VAVLLVFTLVGLLVYASTLGGSADAVPSKARGKPAPTFSLEVLDAGAPSARVAALLERAGADGRITLRELRGTPVVVNFWASWCKYCRNETPMLEARWKQAADDGVVVLGVDVDDDSADARAFLREYEVTYPTVVDADESAADRYRVTGLPATYFISARGELVDQIAGELSAADLEAGIREARH
jgi:cytochrome c biogenesis protein CcmG/thiol:disulfide interchange protein DsbE